MVTEFLLSAAIVGSSFALGIEQRDGRVRVEERHVDNVGVVHRFQYLAWPTNDHGAVMSNRVAVLVGQLEQLEIARVLAELPLPLVLHYATKSQVADALRAEFKSSSRERTWQLADWILDGLDSGEWTDAQLRNVFNLTVTQWNNLKAKLETYRTRWNEMQGVSGE